MIQRSTDGKIRVLSLSYGKDSLACLGAIEKLGWTLDEIVHAEVWATQDIPADLPPMVEFKKKADAIIKERWGFEVQHVCAMRGGGNCLTKNTSTLSQAEANTVSTSTDSRSNKEVGARNSSTVEKLTYQDIFYRVIKNSKSKIRGGVDRIAGFPISTTRGAWCVGLKTNALQDSQRGQVNTVRGNSKGRVSGEQNLWFSASQRTMVQQQSQAPVFSSNPEPRRGKKNILVSYLGIAADEPKRLKRLDGETKISPLVAIGWTEADAKQWCIENDLLSPIYTTAMRGGCWFCHNQSLGQLRLLRKNYPELWNLLLKWDLDSPVTFRPDGHTVHDLDKRFALEDALGHEIKKFRWSMLKQGVQMDIFDLLKGTENE